MKTKKKSKKIIIVAIIFILLLFLVMTRKQKNNVPTNQQNATLQTEEVSKRDLLKSVGTTGTIVSKKSRDLSVSLTDAEVKKVCVSEGDTVKKGQKLIVFDTSDAKENLKDAKTALKNAKQKNELSETDAARNVTDAQTTRNYQISTAKDAMDNAYSEYKEAKNTYTKAKNKLNQFKKTELSAKEAYDTATEEDASVKLTYNTAIANRKKQQEVTTTAKKQMKTLQNTYISQKKTYNQTIASQNSSVEAAKSNQKSTKLSKDTSTQEAQVRQYQKQVDNGVLYAPFEGTITSINYEAGENYTGGTILTLQDCSSYEIEAEIGEYDISDIEEGMSVIIKTDATGDEELKGTVTHISPVSTSSELSASNNSNMASTTNTLSSSDVLYKIRISIDTLHDRLRLDMSANLSIIIEQHNNVLTVPYNAVQTDENGNSYVTVITDDEGSSEIVRVDIVMESNYYTEVASPKLKEGMKVAIEEENESTNPFDNMPQRGGGF